MLEFVTEGLVLDKESRKESDIVVTIYTKKLGLIFGNAASARKIASKLGPHLEPLNLVRLRLVKKKRFQIADALAIGRIERSSETLGMVRFIKEFFATEHAETSIWNLIIESVAGNRDALHPRVVLNVLGFNPDHALCSICNTTWPEYFTTHGHYFCESCKTQNGVHGFCLRVA